MKFIQLLISEKLEIPEEQLIIVAAHRSFQKKPKQDGQAPCSIVVKFLTWETRQKVLHAAWTKKQITYDDRRIYFDQDYTSKLQPERSQYTPIRKELRNKGVRSHLIHPARLKVFGAGGVQVFNSARYAAAALRTQGTISGALQLPEPCTQAEKPPAPFQQRRRQAGEYNATTAYLLKKLMGKP